MEYAYLNNKIHWLQNNYDEKLKRDLERVTMNIDDTHFLKPKGDISKGSSARGNNGQDKNMNNNQSSEIYVVAPAAPVGSVALS